MNRLARIIEGMDREDLLKIKKDLEEGNLKRLIEQKLHPANENRVCPVCSNPVDDSDYEFSFGPEDMRMKARFDGLDCLQHFIAGLAEKRSSS